VRRIDRVCRNLLLCILIGRIDLAKKASVLVTTRADSIPGRFVIIEWTEARSIFFTTNAKKRRRAPLQTRTARGLCYWLAERRTTTTSTDRATKEKAIRERASDDRRRPPS